MRALELLLSEQQVDESRGISARQPGDVYVNPSNLDDTITIIEIKFVRPENDYAFDSYQELEGALDQVIPQDGKRINDNAPNSSSKAAIVAEVETPSGERQFWVRYMKDLMSFHGKWLTFKGYKYQKAIETESLPIKPSDLVLDEEPRTVDQLLDSIDKNLRKNLAGSPFEHMAVLIDQVLENATGANEPITFEKRSQAGIIAKYAGEYAGVIALLSDNIQNMSLSDIEAHYNIENIDKSKIVFPQDTAGMLIDSYLITPDSYQISVSSKMYKDGGAASSLLGIYKIMPDGIAKQYPKGATIVKDLAAMPAFSNDPRKAGTLGPIVLANQMKIISMEDIEEIENLDRNEQNPGALQSPRLKSIISNQGINPETMGRSDYSVYNHLVAAIVNLMVSRVNNEPEFVDVINATLRENSYIQILTKVGLNGNNVTFTYYTKLPDNNNKPFVYNKNYFATGNKGRIGFKLQK